MASEHVLSSVTDKTIYERFLSAASDNPGGAAVRHNNRTLSYGDLLLAVDSIASSLTEVGPEDGNCVAVDLARGPAALMALLAAWQRGFVVACIDRSFPVLRRLSLVRESGASFLITTDDSDLRPSLPSDIPVITVESMSGKVIAMDGHCFNGKRYDASSMWVTTAGLSRLLRPLTPAYIVFTSGTTGRPKGVLGTHEGLAHFVSFQQSLFDVVSDDRVLQTAVLGGDAYLKEVCLSLVSGATLLFPDSNDVLRTMPFGEPSDHSYATIIQTIPSILDNWLALDRHVDLSGLRILALAGEPLTGLQIERLRGQHREFNGNIYSFYGPTETTITKSYYCVPDVAQTGRLPLGVPLPDTDIFVVSADGRRCGPLEVGQIAIHTAYRTLGYINDADAQAAAFVRNPDSDDPNDKLYLTGDLGRFSANGNLHYLGRCNDEIKINGVRVHPSEPESILSSHPGIKAVRVVPIDIDDKPILAAFYQPVSDSTETSTALATSMRDYIEARLPSAMVPTEFICVTEWPLTSQGKVDRDALLEQRKRINRERNVFKPQDDTQARIAACWSSLLKRPISELDGTFFELGGQSLILAISLSRLQHEFDVELSLRDLFQYQTIVRLASHIESLVQRTAHATANENRASSYPVSPMAPDMTATSQTQMSQLSKAQKRLWLLNSLIPGDAAYNMPVAIRIRGSLDMNGLNTALGNIQNRHTMLRVQFLELDGEPYQVINPNSTDCLSYIELVGTVSEKVAKAGTILRNDSMQPFVLGGDTPLRICLIQLDRDDHIFYLNPHHIIMDGWSLGIVLRELLDQLSASVIHEVTPRPKSDYFDYVADQNSSDSDREVDFWTEYLAGDLPILDLPKDGSRTLGAPIAGATVPVLFPAGIAGGVRRLAARLSTIPFVVLLSAFAVLIQRLSGLDDILIGSDYFGRDDPRFDQTVGFFVKTLVYRIDTHGPVSFEELVSRVHTSVLNAQSHLRTDFYSVVQAISPSRDLSATPLFTVMFRMFVDFMDLGESRTSELQAEYFAVEHPCAKFDLTLTLRDTPDGLIGDMEFSSDLYKRGRIEVMIDQYRRILSGFIENPKLDILDLALANSIEPRPEPAPFVDVGQMIAEAARNWPDAIAVTCGSEKITYAQLLQRSRALAQVLRAAGVGTGDVVANSAVKGIGFVVGMVGVLLSGATVFPLDNAIPVMHKEQIYTDASPDALIEVSGALGFAAQVPRFVIECSSGELVGNYPAEVTELKPITDPWQNATLFYTSGSTGRPKAIFGNHGTLAEFVRWESEQFRINETDRVAQITTPSFDAVLRDLFVPLSRGASVRIPTLDVERDSSLFLKFLRDEQITIIHATPSVIDAYLRGGHTIHLPDLRLVALSGEPLTWDFVGRIHERLVQPGAVIANFYGPSETLMIKAFEIVSEAAESGLVPIGKAIDGAEVVCLNKRGIVCAAGEVGQIHIGHTFLTQHAYRDDTLSLEDFVPDPRVGKSGGYLYASGDYGRYLPDGRLTISGRSDDEIKIHGRRIHPAEVSVVLSSHPLVDQAVVLGRTGSANEQRMVAFYTTSNGMPITDEKWKSYMYPRLAYSMMPSEFHHLTAMPMTINGKVDRSALLETAEQPAQQPAVSEVASETECNILKIWREYLNVESISLDASFFRIGGHSLLATIVLTRMRILFGIEIPLRALFEHPTIRSLARHIDDALHKRIENMSEEELMKLINEEAITF